MGRNTGRPNGVVLYDGPSRINGERVILIATFSTKNDKTGNLIQTWILSADKNPIEAINDGSDDAICGDCPLRGIIMAAKDSKYKSKRTGALQHDTVNRQRGCYVKVQHAPSNIWKSWEAGGYPEYDPAVHARWFKRRGLRLGAYGDPVAVPLTAWKKVMKLCSRTQPGYTHQWKLAKFQAWRRYVMASTHSESEVELANSKGWRSYRTRTADDELLEGETVCPASEEGDYQHTCESCGACNGKRDDNDRRPNMAIIAHGGDSKITGVLTVIENASV